MNELVNNLSLAQLESASIEQLKEEFSKTLQVTSEHLLYMSLIWQALKDRGVDLPELTGLLAYIPKIAKKQLDPRFVVKFSGNRTLLDSLARLPIDKQEEMAKTGTVQVVKNDNLIDMDLSKLTLHDVRQVFDADKGIRNSGEQMLWLKAKNKVQRKPKSTSRKNYRQVLLDENNEYLLLGGDAKVKIETVLTTIGELYDIDMFSVMSKYSKRIAEK